jgi:hypothetical protein
MTVIFTLPPTKMARRAEGSVPVPDERQQNRETGRMRNREDEYRWFFFSLTHTS